MPGHPNSAGDETMICTCQSRERIQGAVVGEEKEVVVGQFDSESYMFLES